MTPLAWVAVIIGYIALVVFVCRLLRSARKHDEEVAAEVRRSVRGKEEALGGRL